MNWTEFKIDVEPEIGAKMKAESDKQKEAILKAYASGRSIASQLVVCGSGLKDLHVTLEP